MWLPPNTIGRHVEKGSAVEPNGSTLASLPQKILYTNTSKTTSTTNDFYLSAFLVASNIPLSSHQRWNGKTFFKFAETDGLPQLNDEYNADQVKVSPIRHGNSLKNPKALIYAGNANQFVLSQNYPTSNDLSAG